MDTSSLCESISNAMLSDLPDFESFPLAFETGLSPLPYHNEQLSSPGTDSFDDFLSFSSWGLETTPDSGFDESENSREQIPLTENVLGERSPAENSDKDITTTESVDVNIPIISAKRTEKKCATTNSSTQTLASKTTEPIPSVSDEPLKTKKKVHRKNQPPDGDLLPPCRVCGEKASGLHYGANTCEPCKGFFRRSIVKVLKKKEEYVCPKEGNCPLGTGKRSMCSYCRYQQCLKVGMSQDAIKIGRYTYEKKTKDIKEVNMIKKGHTGTVETATSSEMATKDQDISQEDDDRLLETLIGIQEEFHDDYKKLFIPEELLKKQLSVYEKYKLRNETFGTGNPLPWPVYEEFLNTTGIELDDRRTKMKTMVIRQNDAIHNMMKFARHLPGFSDLTIHDQFALFKGSFFEYKFLSFHKRINNDLNVIAGNDKYSTSESGFPDGGLHISDMTTIVEENKAKLCFEFAANIQKCQLTVEEVTLACGIVLTFTDRCKLEEPEKVEQIQWNLVNCLKRFIKRKHQHPEKRLWQIFDKLTTLRIGTEYSRKERKSKEFRGKWRDYKDFPLVEEVLHAELE